MNYVVKMITLLLQSHKEKPLTITYIKYLNSLSTLVQCVYYKYNTNTTKK